MFKYVLLLCLVSSVLNSQAILYFQAVYPNQIREWRFLDDEESDLGSLRARWIFEQDLSQWDIRLGELSGSVQQKWKNQPHDWEIRLHNSFIAAQPVWPRQYDTWRLQFNDRVYTFSMDYDPEGSLWRLTTDETDILAIYNTYLYDFMDWTLEYASDVDDPILVVASCFLAAVYSNLR